MASPGSSLCKLAELDINGPGAGSAVGVMAPPPTEQDERDRGERISHAHVLGAIFERLPLAEQSMTVSRISCGWRQWAAARAPAIAFRAHDTGGAPELPEWCVREAWPRLTGSQRAARAEHAARQGNTEALEWMGEQGGFHWSDGSCQAAAGSGHLNTLQWLRRQQPPAPWGEGTCAAAAAGGHLDVLQWARDQWPPCPWGRVMFRQAARGGHLAVLQWLRRVHTPFESDMWACQAAASGGHLEVLQWLRQHRPPYDWDEMACAAVARGGHLEVLQWMRRQAPPCPWNADVCTLAARGGHLAVLQWLRQQQPPCPWSEEACSVAARTGQLAVLQWLRQQQPPCGWDRVWCSIDAARIQCPETRAAMAAWIESQPD